MKQVLNAILDFLEAWGEHRYQASKRYGSYY